MMKKYWGKKDWSETLYLCYVFDEDDDQYFDSNGVFVTNLEDGKREFSLPLSYGITRFNEFRDINSFEDVNGFLTFSEGFNVYQDGKI